MSATTEKKREALDVARAAGGDTSPRVKGESTYVVQVERSAGIPHSPDSDALDWIPAWLDIATVTVPQRTPRRVVFREALKQAKLKPTPDADPLRLRALDAASAAATDVPAVQPDPEWVI